MWCHTEAVQEISNNGVLEALWLHEGIGDEASDHEPGGWIW